MFNGFCHFGNWGSFGNFGPGGWIGLFAALTLLVMWVARHARASAATVLYGTGQPTAKEILQTRYAHGEITREQYQQILVHLS